MRIGMGFAGLGFLAMAGYAEITGKILGGRGSNSIWITDSDAPVLFWALFMIYLLLGSCFLIIAIKNLGAPSK